MSERWEIDAHIEPGVHDTRLRPGEARELAQTGCSKGSTR